MNSIKNAKNYALFGAVDEGDVDAVRKLLDDGADPNFMPKSKDSLLQTAVMRNNKDIVRLLLDKGADPKAQSKKCLLKLAIGEIVDEEDSFDDNTEMVKLLLEKGVDPNLHSSRSLFQLAIRQHNDEIIKLLFKHKAKLEFEHYNEDEDEDDDDVMEYIFHAHNSHDCYEFIKLIVDYNKDAEFIKNLFFKLTFSVFHDALAVKAFELLLDNGLPIDDFVISIEIDYLGTKVESEDEDEYESSEDDYGYGYDYDYKYGNKRKRRKISEEKLEDEYTPLHLCVDSNKIGFVRK